MIKNLTNETDLSGLYFVYNGSTNLEKKGWYGLAHFGEHLKCKCFEDLHDELQSNGISWNAYTSDNRVVFYFTGLEEYLAPFRDTIIQKMYQPFNTFINLDIIEKEKKIVLEEYQDSFTNQNEIFYMNLMRKKFNHYSPIGLKEDIENYSLKDCEDFYNLQYNKPDLIINVSKSFVLNNELLFENRTHLLKNDWNKNYEAPLEIRGSFPDTLCLYYYRTVDEKDVPIIKIINYMLGNGLNSPLYQEIREKRGLCYQVGSYIHEIGKLPIMIISILTSPEKSDIVHTTLDEIFENKDIHLSQARFEIIKKELIISKKKKMINRHVSISDVIDDKVSIFETILETINLDDIMNIFNKYFIITDFNKVDDKNF